MKLRNNPFLVSIAFVTSAFTSANAAQITWLGNTSGVINLDANWVGGVQPTAGGTDGMLFGVAGTAGTALTMNANRSFSNTGGAIVFSANAPTYTISGTGLITIGTGSIVNNSGVLQVINNNLKRNTGNNLTIGATGGILEFNGTYDIVASSLTQLSFGTTVGGEIAFKGGIVNTGAAGTYGLTLTALTAPATGTVVLGGTNTALNGTVTRGSQTTLKLISAGALNSGQAVVAGANTTNNDTLWLASDASVNAFNMSYVGGETAKHNIVLGTGSSGNAVTTQQFASLTIAGQQSTNFYKAGNVISGTPTLTVTGTTSILGEATNARTTLLGASGVNLVLGAVTSTAGTAQSKLTLDGTTSGSRVTGVIDNGLSGISLNKAGSGTWALTNANTYLGATSVNGGTLSLDFNAAGAPTSDILYNGVADGAVQLGGNGNFAIQGKNSTASSQTVGALSVKSNQGGVITLAAGTSGTTTFNVASYTYTTGSVLNFNLGANTVFDNNAIIAAGAVGSGAFINSNEYARYLANGTLTAAVVGNGLNNQIDPNNAGGTSSYYKQDGSHTRLANFTFKGIRLTNTGNGDSLDMGGFTLNASNSSILYRGGGDNVYNISNGTLAGNTNLIFQVVSGATLNIASNAAMTGTSSFTKSGAGMVAITGAKAYTGLTNVMEGVLSVDTLANGGSDSGVGASTNAAANLRFSGGTLRYTGGVISTDRSFQIEGPGAIIDASGSGALTWAPAVAIAFSNVDNSAANSASAAQNQSFTFTGTSTADNTFGSASGLIVDGAVGRTSVTKSGSGKWILNQANTYTGGTQINGGTLGVTNASALCTYGAISFGGGTLQYGSGINQDFSHRIQHSTGAIGIDTNGNNVAFQSRLDETNISGLTKSGSGTLTLVNSNLYTGATAVNEGTLLIGTSGSLANTAVKVGGAGTNGTPTLAGGGTIGGATIIAAAGGGVVGTHSPGAVASGGADGVGKQTFSSSVTYETGSIFEWNLAAVPSETGRGTSYDAINAASLGSTTGAIFRVVLNGTQDFTSTFWDTDRTWSDIFKTGDAGSNLSIASIFTGTIQYYNGGGTALASISDPTTQGAFTFSGTDLKWSAVPEPTSALAGLLVTAGLLRRRRCA